MAGKGPRFASGAGVGSVSGLIRGRFGAVAPGLLGVCLGPIWGRCVLDLGSIRGRTMAGSGGPWSVHRSVPGRLGVGSGPIDVEIGITWGRLGGHPRPVWVRFRVDLESSWGCFFGLAMQSTRSEHLQPKEYDKLREPVPRLAGELSALVRSYDLGDWTESLQRARSRILETRGAAVDHVYRQQIEACCM